MSKKQIQKILIPSSIVIASVLVAMILNATYLFERLEHKLFDLRMLYRGAVSTEHSDIILIDISDDTCLELGERFPISRNHYATLIRNLTLAGTKLIVFDIQFTEPDLKNPEYDDELAQAIKECGNVISAGKYFYDEINGKLVPVEVPPIPKIKNASLEWGTVGEIKDSDDVLRHYSLFTLAKDSTNKLSIGMQAIKHLKNFDKDEEITFDSEKVTFGDFEMPRSRGGNEIFINYYGNKNSFKVWNFALILDTWDVDLLPDANGNDTDTDFMDLYIGDFEGIPDSIRQKIQAKNPFKDKIAIVGVSLAEAHDLKLTPFSRVKDELVLMPGYETHAHAIQTILDRRFISKFSGGFLYWLFAFFLATLVTLAIIKPKNPFIGIIFAISIGAGYFFFSFWIFDKHDFMFDIISGELTILITFIAQSSYKLALSIKERKQIEGMFGHYLHPNVIDQLKSNPNRLNLGGNEVEASVIFSDVAGFTSISEKLSNYELVALLNAYLTEMSDLIMDEMGIIDKYEGDAIMAEFGIPINTNEHALQACRAALRMKVRLKHLREVKWKDTNRPPLYARIGVNSGKMVAGNMGSQKVFDYTVMGDEVNLSSRLEGANKQFGTAIMIGENTFELVKDKFYIRYLGQLKVKGKKEPKVVYELMDFLDSPLKEDLEKIVNFYNKGISLYKDRKFGEALEFFKKSLPLERVDGERSPSSVYIARCEEFIINPPPEDWDDISELTEK